MHLSRRYRFQFTKKTFISSRSANLGSHICATANMDRSKIVSLLLIAFVAAQICAKQSQSFNRRSERKPFNFEDGFRSFLFGPFPVRQHENKNVKPNYYFASHQQQVKYIILYCLVFSVELIVVNFV